MTSLQLTTKIREFAQQLGFAQSGICPALPTAGFSKFREWLEAGFAGEMDYLQNRLDAYRHPSGVLEGARSVVMLTLPYRNVEPQSTHAGQGRVSRYAWGPRDYHDVIHDKLKQLVAFMKQQVPDSNSRGVVDTAPLFERELAQLAGLGWIGKHTLLLNREAGSWFFLAAFITDVELQYDSPYATNHCGTCRACLDACPTDAFREPYVLDARRCISYMTIELRDAIPHDLRTGMGDWVFGCDVCQDVCPWNRQTPESQESAFEPIDFLNPLNLHELFSLSDEGFRKRLRKTPLWRTKRRGILRNAAIVLGNQRDEAAVPSLARGIADDESLVRGASAWALGQIGGEEARRLLQARALIEEDAEVREEISRAI